MIKKYKSRVAGAPRQTDGEKRDSYPRFRKTTEERPAIMSSNSLAGKLRVMVLGGLEEVGRNMTVVEYEDDIIIIDMGLQFPEEDMPGIDYIIPNITYLRDKIDHIKGVIITHGHFDHIGGIPHIMGEIGNPPIFMGKLTAGLVKKKCVEHSKCPKLNDQVVDETSVLKLGKNFRVSFLRVNHSIPDCFAIIVDTPVGRLIHTGDFKIDYSPVNDKPADLQRVAQIGSEGVLLLMADSTDSTHPGYQVSESAIGMEMDKIFEKIEGRIIIGTFASQLARVQNILNLAEKHGRRVYLQGRSMNDNIEIAHQIGYLKFNPRILIRDGELNKLPDNKILILGTGAQGESNAFLVRVVSHEHKTIHLKEGDTVIFSSSVIPGNERSIQSLMDMITRQGADVINYEMMDVHAGGHAKQEDLKLMMRLFKPEYLMPIEGNHYMLKAHGDLGIQVGIPKDNVFVADNGQVAEFSKDQSGRTIGKLTREKAVTDYVMVDGLGVGDVSDIVLRDRRVMAEDGMIVIIATVDTKSGKTIGNPDIISRGFVYMKENRELIETTRMKVKKMVESHDPRTSTDMDYLKNRIRDEVGQFLFTKTQRRPMVLPVVIKV